MKKWIGTPPEKCDFCSDKIVYAFVDGKTIYGPWACMCSKCFLTFGIKFGEGYGQLYELQNGEYVKWEGK